MRVVGPGIDKKEEEEKVERKDEEGTAEGKSKDRI